MNNEIIKISENTWRIEDGVVRFFLLAGSEKALLIDSGVSTPDAKKIAESLTSLPLFLLNTHGDRDHISGNAAFSSFYMHPDDYKNCGIADSFPDCELLPVKDGDIIDLGGRPLELIVIPGHTYGSVAVLDVNNRALYPGDSVQAGHVFMFGKHRYPAGYPSALKKLYALHDKFDILFPSHDVPELPSDYIMKVYDAWNKVCEGKIPAVPADMHGTKVLSYDLDICGFYCDAD